MGKGKDFTIMFLSESSGRHFAFKLSRAMLGFIAIVFVIFVCVTALSYWGYAALRRQNDLIRSTIQQHEQELADLRSESKEAKLYKQWADGIIFKRLHFEDASGKGNTRESQSMLDGVIYDKKSAEYSILDVDEFDVRRLNLNLDFEVFFKLINHSHDNRKICGYIFVIARNSEVVPEIYATWPQTKIVSGMPRDYTGGVDFAIRYMKHIKGRINQPDIGPKFNRIDLLAYSDDGKILMKKGFYVERMLQQSPYE